MASRTTVGIPKASGPLQTVNGAMSVPLEWQGKKKTGSGVRRKKTGRGPLTQSQARVLKSITRY